MRVLIVGVSTRGLAESATKAGYEVVAIDGFGDLDLRSHARTVTVARRNGRFSVRAALAAARTQRADAVVYESSFDNHPGAVRALAANRTVWGNPPAVLRRARDPRRLARVLQAAGLPGPQVRLTRPPRLPRRAGRTWILKPQRSGGGDGVVVWRRGTPVPRGSYLQERITGVAGSMVFAANGRDAVPLGLSRILAGEAGLGGDGFRYNGNILAPAGDPQFPADDRLFDTALRLVQVVTVAFGLVGVNGVDFIARRGVPYAIEINPRYTAAMELVERAYGLSLFDVHARVCRGEPPPPFDLAEARRRHTEAVGKAVLYARGPATLGDSCTWLTDPDVRDISPPGTRFAPRDPICTVFARGRDAAACFEGLTRRAARLYEAIEQTVRIA